jgi:methylisocitrate lyase
VGRSLSPAERFRQALDAERPLQIVGAVNAYSALLAARAGFRAIYVSGAGVANASYGLPDLGITTLNDVLEDVRRIGRVTPLPVLVDCDTGWGGAFSIERTVRDMAAAGAAAVHLEDQVQAKRCGHRPGKGLVSAAEMADRVIAAAAGRGDPPGLLVMARTDAYSVEGLDAAIERARRYVAAGADLIFAEAMESPGDYQRFCSSVAAPVLANLTEFGKTPLFTVDQMRQAGVAMVLYPLSAFRAMSRAAERTYAAIRTDGTQRAAIPLMQTREELYDVLGYHDFERKLDALFAKEEADE